MKFHMTKVLRFWVDVEYERVKNHASGHSRTELVAQILRKFEEAGEAIGTSTPRVKSPGKRPPEC
jgi:hypothetical protein